MKNFKIIVFLGVDGSGKSTLIDSIVKKNRLKFIENKKSRAKIYPNPGRENLWIEGAGDIKIINAQGQVIIEINNSDNLQNINTSNWPQGLYYVSVKDKHEIWIKSP